MNIGSGLDFLVTTLFKMYLYIVIARFMLQVARADFYNPASQLIVKLTAPLLTPLRRVIPGYRRIDVASIVLFLLLILVMFLIRVALFGPGLGGLSGATVIINVLYLAISTIFDFLIGVIFISVILSWVAPPGQNPFADAIRYMAEPILAPARQVIPPMGGLDFSPMIVLLGLYFIRITFGI